MLCGDVVKALDIISEVGDVLSLKYSRLGQASFSERDEILHGYVTGLQTSSSF